MGIPRQEYWSGLPFLLQAEQDESQSLLPSRWASQNQYGPNPEEGSRNDQENLERS